jgi:hypothetical protein
MRVNIENSFRIRWKLKLARRQNRSKRQPHDGEGLIVGTGLVVKDEKTIIVLGWGRILHNGSFL